VLRKGLRSKGVKECVKGLRKGFRVEERVKGV